MTPMAQSTSSVIPRSNFESMTDSTLNSATIDEDRDSPTESHGVSDRGEDREARVLPDEFEEVFEHLRSLTFFREGSGAWISLSQAAHEVFDTRYAPAFRKRAQNDVLCLREIDPAVLDQTKIVIGPVRLSKANSALRLHGAV